MSAATPCRCGASYAAAAFEKLAAVRILAPADLAPLVVRWPVGVVVHVRACARCANPIARLARVDDPADVAFRT